MGYDGFISYSHTADDELAPSLQRGLQRHAKPWNTRRALRIFHDETGLSTNPHLWAAIEQALDESEWFVLLASPEAAQSEWVNKEISHWRATRAESRAFSPWSRTGRGTGISTSVTSRRSPPRYRTHCEGRSPRSPVAWTCAGPGPRRISTFANSQFRSTVAENLAAPMHGVPKDELEGEESARQRAAPARRRAGITALAVLVVISIALGLLTLASRNHAVSIGNTARAQALAARSQNELSADPEVSVVLARRAVQVSPIPEAVAALRQAIDASPVAVALPTESGRQCGFESGPAIVPDPKGDRIAESLCTGDVIAHDAASGHVIERRHVAREASVVAYDSTGHVLAVGTDRGVELLDPSTLHIRSRLAGHGEANTITFSPGGTQLAATTDLGVTVWDLASGTLRFSVEEPAQDRTLAYAPDGRFLVVGTTGVTEVVDVGTGEIVRRLSAPDQPLMAFSVNPIAVTGDHLVVANNVTGPGDVSADIDVWNTTTWTMEGVLTQITGTSVGSVALSPDGTRVAVGNFDGTGGVWSRDTKDQLVALAGQTAALGTIAFSPTGRPWRPRRTTGRPGSTGRSGPRGRRCLARCAAVAERSGGIVTRCVHWSAPTMTSSSRAGSSPPVTRGRVHPPSVPTRRSSGWC